MTPPAAPPERIYEGAPPSSIDQVESLLSELQSIETLAKSGQWKEIALRADAIDQSLAQLRTNLDRVAGNPRLFNTLREIQSVIEASKAHFETRRGQISPLVESLNSTASPTIR